MSHLDSPRSASRSDLRKFALLVGGVFLALSAIAFGRHKAPRTIGGFGGVGALLVVAGVVAPQVLRPIYAGWMRFALMLSTVTTPILMAVIYFVVLTPTSWFMRAFGWRGLRKLPKTSVWVTRAEGARASALERQF